MSVTPLLLLLMAAGLNEADVEDVVYLWHRGLGVYSQRAGKLTDPLIFRIATVHDAQQQSQVNTTSWQVVMLYHKRMLHEAAQGVELQHGLTYDSSAACKCSRTFAWCTFLSMLRV